MSRSSIRWKFWDVRPATKFSKEILYNSRKLLPYNFSFFLGRGVSFLKLFVNTIKPVFLRMHDHLSVKHNLPIKTVFCAIDGSNKHRFHCTCTYTWQQIILQWNPVNMNIIENWKGGSLLPEFTDCGKIT